MQYCIQRPMTQSSQRLTCSTILSSLLIAGSCFADADNVETLNEVDLFAEIPVVTSATRLEQSVQQSPAAITILDKETIRASGVTEVSQLFNLIPGFYAYHVSGNQLEVARGIADDFPSDFEVIIDGRSVYEPINSAVEWASLGISIQDIEYIEVVRGSNAPAYGSNASLGAINIVTTSPLEATGTHIDITASDNDLNTRDANLRHYINLGDLNGVLSINYKSNDGFPPLPSPDIEDRNIDGAEVLNASFRAIYTPNLSNTLEVQLGGGESDIKAANIDDARGFSVREFKRSHQLIRWQHRLDESDLQLTFYHNRLEIDDRIEQVFDPSDLANADFFLRNFLGYTGPTLTAADVTGLKIENGLSERYDLETQYRNPLGLHHRLVAGIGVRYDRIRGEQLLGRTDAIDDWRYRAFLSWEWSFHTNWLLNAGIMAENANMTDTQYSPRLGLNFELLPEHTLRASITQSYRIPSLLEGNETTVARFQGGAALNLAQASAEDIHETEINELEVGYLASFFEQKLQFDIRLFKTDANDALAQFDGTIGQGPVNFLDPPNDGVDILANTIDYRIEGAELQLKARPDERTLIHVSYSHNRFTGTHKKASATFESLDNQLPEDNLSILVKRTLFTGLDLSLTWYHWSESEPFQGTFIDDRNRLDARLAQTFNIGKTAGTIELIVHNLADEQQFDFEDINPIERTVLLRASLMFN